VDDRQAFFSHTGIAKLSGGEMPVARLFQTDISFPIISDNQRFWLNGVFDESAKRLGAAVGNYGKPDAPRIASSFPFVEIRARFTLANINGCHHHDHVMDTATFPTCAATNQGLIDLNMLYSGAADAILVWTHHTSAKLMQ
jgi:hypothetical protein